MNKNLGEIRNRQFSKINTSKLLKLLILHVLSKGKSYYGTEISDIISNDIMKGNWRPNNGLLYPVLLEIEANGWITGWWDEPDRKNKKHYKITDDGIQHYNNIKLIYKPLIEETIKLNKYILDEIY